MLAFCQKRVCRSQKAVCRSRVRSSHPPEGVAKGVRSAAFIAEQFFSALRIYLGSIRREGPAGGGGRGSQVQLERDARRPAGNQEIGDEGAKALTDRRSR